MPSFAQKVKCIMSNKLHLRGCGNCGLTTLFQPVRFENGSGIQCLTCGKRWVAHHCSTEHATLGGLQKSEPEWLPLLIDFGVNRAFDAYCPGCRHEINVLRAASKAIQPYSPQASSFLNQLADALAVGMLLVTAVGVGGWIARQLD